MHWLCSLLLAVTCAPAFSAQFFCDPATGSLEGDGSAARPWPALEEALKAKKVQLTDAAGKLSNPTGAVKPGDTILLRSGWHGCIRIPFGYNPQPITIASEMGHSPQAGWIEVGQGRNWVIRGLTISPSLAPKPLARMPRHLVQLGESAGTTSANLVVENCFIYSVLDSSGWTSQEWVTNAPSGIWLGRHGTGHVARNNYVLNTRFGINLCAPECVAEGNVVANFSADGIRTTRDSQVVQYNVIKNNFVSARDGDNNHDDGIQAFLFNAGKGKLQNTVIRGNIIINREEESQPLQNSLQGIGFFDGPLVNFLVESNVVRVSHYHGVSLYDAQESLVRGNVCFSSWQTGPRPWVMLGQKKNQASRNTVQDNLAHSFNFKADPAVKAEHNDPVTPELFQQRLSALRKVIEDKYGAVHPTARRPRLNTP